MSTVKRVRVTISDSKLIPTIGKGPIHSPISITEEQYNMLVNLGYKVVKAGDVKVAKIEPVTPVAEPVEEEPVVEVTEVEPEVTQEEEVVVVEEEPVVEVVEEEEEATEEVEESEEDVAYTMEDLSEATKKELKAILDGREVNYGYNDTLKELKEAVVASNPA
jgi:hypothetical protein